MIDNERWPERGAAAVNVRPKPRKENIASRFSATLGFLAGASRRRPGGRRFYWILIVLMTMAGIGMLSYPFATTIWANRIQDAKRHQITSKENIQAYVDKTLKVGAAFTKLFVPKLGIDIIVVEGTTGNALRAGAGHYPDSALPGDNGNVAIAGHRTGFGEPFRHLERLREGDEAVLVTPIGKFTYQMMPGFDGHGNPWVTDPLDWSVVGPAPDAVLTLTTCDPPHTSQNRLIARFLLVKSEVAVQ
jgi:sortase A